MTAKEQIIPKLPDEIRRLLEREDFTRLEEIRLRSQRQVTLYGAGEHKRLPHTATRSDIERTLQLVSGSSVYAYIDEIKNCFITLEGGHRVGLCGRAVLHGGGVANITHVSGVNFRVARQVPGAANAVMPFVVKDGEVANTLIISPPQCGKTTLLRDLARQIGGSRKVSVIDERGEIAASHNGVPQHDVGEMTDVLDLCPKAIGIPLMLRSMSPEVIVTDEIADCDVSAVGQALSCGVKIIATAHGDDFRQVLRRVRLDGVIDEFGCIITLSRRHGPGTVEKIN
ncbi:MAG: stage III sporulation protein AA [Clostridiales bacterium]|jgi:stage III sporulation protein AA|nr:stage III sporulation protein AA [Clostridiales bacterium]